MQDELVLADLDRVAGVVAPLGTNDDVGFLGEDVDDFSLSFIAPLAPTRIVFMKSEC
jgi:hypothetical protein